MKCQGRVKDSRCTVFFIEGGIQMKKILLASAALFLLAGCAEDTEPEVAPSESIEEASEPMIDEPAETVEPAE